MPIQNATTLHEPSTNRMLGVQVNEPDETSLIPMREQLAEDVQFMSPTCVMIKYKGGSYALQWVQ